MAVVLHQFTGAAGPGRAEALDLARHCADQYALNIMFGPGGGIAAASCWAAVAVVPGVAHPALYPVHALFAGAPIAPFAPLGFGAVFGNSQMVSIRRRVTVPGYAGAAHAERAALRGAGIAGLALHAIAANQAVLFVQLAPCGPCNNWLNGVPGRGVANPFAAAIAGAWTLHVWYRWPYPAGIANMVAWNSQTRTNQLNDINNNW